MAKGSERARCDVLVVGGGLAATMAAISAAEAGADVLMAVKGEHGASGSSARSAGVVAAAFGHVGVDGEPLADSADSHVADTLRLGCGLGSEPHVRVLAENAPEAVRELERLGVAFSKNGRGRYVQLRAPGNSTARACSVLGGGRELMRILGECLEEHGVRVLPQATVTALARADGRVTGARLLAGRTATPRSVDAGAVVLAAGGATGLFPTVSGDPRNTGDPIVLGYEAGATLANLEFVEFTLIYRVGGRLLRVGGLAPFISRGALLVDAGGEPVLPRHHDEADIAGLGRAELLRAVVRETAAGRGPVSLDCRHFADTLWDEFERSQGATVLDPLREAGCDYREETIEVVPAAHSVLAGLVTEPDTSTGVPGLYAAGECATGVHGAARLSGNGLAACLVFGRLAGAGAAAFARENPAGATAEEDTAPAVTSPDARDVRRCREHLAGLAEEALGVVRDGATLAAARAEFRALREAAAGAAASSHPALLELRNLALLGELMATAAERRTESRGLHFRSDHETSETRWQGWQLVHRGGDGEPEWRLHDRLEPAAGAA